MIKVELAEFAQLEASEDVIQIYVLQLAIAFSIGSRASGENRA